MYGVYRSCTVDRENRNNNNEYVQDENLDSEVANYNIADENIAANEYSNDQKIIEDGISNIKASSRETLTDQIGKKTKKKMYNNCKS